MQDRTDRLIERYCSGSLDCDEARELDAWLSESRRNQIYFRRRIAEYGSVPSQHAEEVWRKFSDRHKTLFATARGGRFRISAVRWAAGIAAATIIGASVVFRPFGGVWQNDAMPAETVAQQLEYRTGCGEILNIVLPDGSTVCLNSETRLVVAADFGKTTREIDFDGEGFFNIARDTQRPFIIHSDKDDYTVLGTSFNLQSYANDKFAVVTLHTGCLQAKVRKDVIVLDPCEQLQIDAESKTISKREVNVDDSIGWLSGRLVFSGLPLRDVVNKLSRRFQVKINVHADLARQQYTGVVDEETLDEALNMLVVTSPTKMCVTNIDGEYFLSKAACTGR
ncbi:MAG: FecR domain-containing protein [Alistipes sp.]|nr:FecR domain-containing protein [Alistipes sp.]